jgi:hypothetical protein
MEITQHTSEKLVIEQKNSLQSIIPLAIGGAGLLLTLGMIREYGVQAWYRTPYWLGGTIAFIGILFALMVPESYRTVFHRLADRVTVQVKRGMRVVQYETYPLSAIDGVRIEQGQATNKQGETEIRYRLAISVVEQWVPLLPKWQGDLYEHQSVAQQVQAFLAEPTEKTTKG